MLELGVAVRYVAMRRSPTPPRQHGATLYALLFGLAVVVAIGTATLAVHKAYVEFIQKPREPSEVARLRKEIAYLRGAVRNADEQVQHVRAHNDELRKDNEELSHELAALDLAIHYEKVVISDSALARAEERIRTMAAIDPDRIEIATEWAEQSRRETIKRWQWWLPFYIALGMVVCLAIWISVRRHKRKLREQERQKALA